jgi:hypothetical protein
MSAKINLLKTVPHRNLAGPKHCGRRESRRVVHMSPQNAPRSRRFSRVCVCCVQAVVIGLSSFVGWIVSCSVTVSLVLGKLRLRTGLEPSPLCAFLSPVFETHDPHSVWGSRLPTPPSSLNSCNIESAVVCMLGAVLLCGCGAGVRGNLCRSAPAARVLLVCAAYNLNNRVCCVVFLCASGLCLCHRHTCRCGLWPLRPPHFLVHCP